MNRRELARIRSRADHARRVWEAQPCPLAVVELAALVPRLVTEIERLQAELDGVKTQEDDIQDLYW